jgi:hypothetical protein
MNTYNVHLLWPDGYKEKIQIHVDGIVTSLTDIPRDRYHRIYTSIDSGAKLRKIIGPLGQKKSTPKQKLAQKYGFILGSIKGAKVQVDNCFNPFTHSTVFDPDKAAKWAKAKGLVNMQFSKLQRDIADLFKLAGLKIK